MKTHYATIHYKTAYGSARETGPCVLVITTANDVEVYRSMPCRDKTDAENAGFDWAEANDAEVEWRS